MDYKKLLELDGREKYLRKIIEELNELACSLSHYQDSKISIHAVLDEHADVMLQLEKLLFLMKQDLNDYTDHLYFNFTAKKTQLKNLIDKKSI